MLSTFPSIYLHFIWGFNLILLNSNMLFLWWTSVNGVLGMLIKWWMRCCSFAYCTWQETVQMRCCTWAELSTCCLLSKQAGSMAGLVSLTLYTEPAGRPSSAKVTYPAGWGLSLLFVFQFSCSGWLFVPNTNNYLPIYLPTYLPTCLPAQILLRSGPSPHLPEMWRRLSPITRP